MFKVSLVCVVLLYGLGVSGLISVGHALCLGSIWGFAALFYAPAKK